MKQSLEGKFLNPDDLKDYSKETKAYYLKKGFLPYLTKNDRIKWVQPSYIHYKENKKKKKGILGFLKSLFKIK